MVRAKKCEKIKKMAVKKLSHGSRVLTVIMNSGSSYEKKQTQVQSLHSGCALKRNINCSICDISFNHRCVNLLRALNVNINRAFHSFGLC